MRIGVMLRSIGEPGGIGVYTQNLLKALFRLDQKNQYFLIYRRLDQLGAFVGFGNVTEKVIRAPSKLWWDQVSVPRLAKDEWLDIIFNPKLSVPLLSRSKTILVMHGAEQFVVPQAFKWHDRLYFTIANPLYCKRASAIISMTHLGAKHISQYMGANPEKIHIISEAYNERCRVLNKEEKDVAKRKYALPDRFILFVGGLSPLKNFGNLLRAYAMTRNVLPHKLVVVGFNRFKFTKDLLLVDQLNLRDEVVFMGYVPDEDIPLFYNLADLFALPSLYEGFGIPILEAMACGCPVITSKTGCSPEVAGDAGVLVDPYNPQEIADAMVRVLTNESLKQKLISQGLQRVQDFSWDKCARETLALFESLNGRIA